jgi:branched-chain amino acid transport system ATP-binding protein
MEEDPPMSMLQLEGISKNFGALKATDDVSFTIEAGQRVALVGPNGAGKTTLFNLISGELTPDAGTVRFEDHDITNYSPERVVAAGLGRTFQRNSLFLGGTVYENVRLAVQRRLGIRFQMLRSVEKYSRLRQETEEILDRIQLTDRARTLASELSYGEQRQLELAIALATSPKVLLLDEPAAGMSIKETQEMVTMLKSLPPAMTLLIVEHDMDVVEAVAQRVIVLNFGKVLADGPLEEVRKNKEVLAAYLGVTPEEVPDA